MPWFNWKKTKAIEFARSQSDYHVWG